jgi:natural product biosynthesis luciferase-like monooxygenase protein
MAQSEVAFFIGEGSLVIQAAARWLDAGHTIAGIATRDRGIKDFANARAIVVIDPKDHDAIVKRATDIGIDVLFSVVNLSMLPERILKLPKKHAINFHDGPLPAYAGLYATTWALVGHERTHAVTWHEMTTEADTGRILVQSAFDIADGETAFSLNAKCYTAGIESFATLVDGITNDTLTPVEQDFTKRTYFGLKDRPGAACVIDLDASLDDITALVAALDFGTYPNPVGRARLRVDGGVFLVERATRADVSAAGAAPGTVLRSDEAALDVVCKDGVVRFEGLTSVDGNAPRAALMPTIGRTLPGLSSTLKEDLVGISQRAASDEAFFLRRLEQQTAVTLPFLRDGTGSGAGALELELPAAISAHGASGVLAAIASFVARASSEARFDLGFSEPRIDALTAEVSDLFATEVPLRVDLNVHAGYAAARTKLDESLAAVRKRSTYARDLLARQPALKALPRREGSLSWPVVVRFVDDIEQASAIASADLTLAIAADGRRCRWLFDRARVDEAALASIEAQLFTFLEHLGRDEKTPLAGISLLSANDEARLRRFNDTERPVPHTRVHTLFEARVDAHPDDIALHFRDQTLTYAELDARANTVAHALKKHGVGPDALVGVYAERSPAMVIACLAIWKAGGAYVPLDPAYPADRIAFMVEDARMPIVLTEAHLVGRLPAKDAIVLVVDKGDLAEPTRERAVSRVTPENLAYVIYTSGSTGRPKGVMIEHRNVVNFFVGMDERLHHDGKPGVWLAVTSLSFDISVLELFWTLTRGFAVVLYREPSRRAAARRAAAARPVDLSLFYFSSDEGERARDKYRLLIEGAKFADQNGFVAVWTPERHFHAFGGLYPNPSVASAALAMITEKVSLRAGSCVSPLHSPIRIAEEWSLVDNLSGGRVGISFAAGWQPNDFVLRPENFADRKNQMFRDIDAVRRLWRGEAVSFRNGAGRDIPTTILPRPLQAELPVWVTAAGNPETFEEAAKVGAHMLTHLLGQTFDELKEKIELYRRTWAAAGHKGKGIVSLMLHTFVGTDKAAVKEIVREPMKGYLKSAVGLIKEAAWSFPTFKQSTTLADGTFGVDHLGPEEMDALLDHAFERYYATSGFFGDIDAALDIVERVRDCDVDEIACLIDFGIPSDTVLEYLPTLAAVREEASPSIGMHSTSELDFPLAVMVERYGVTHVQCTPSMATMFTLDETGRKALGQVKTMMVGGEALPIALARDLQSLVGGRLINMYGPTETTIWSTTWALEGPIDAVPIGTPIANTDVLVLDAHQQPSPVGALGELGIGGLGVVRGYLGRPELTAERFVPHPWRTGERIYRTGDLVRFRDDGVLEFHGRIDHQVKIRGYRIELGEIESRLTHHAAIREAVVIAREDTPGDKRLVAYLIAREQERPTAAELKVTLRETLPDFMVPSFYVWLESFPQTPNRKIDRKALPAPEGVSDPSKTESARPEGQLEQTIAKLWCEVLGVPSVGVDDNFFDLGGHSLLTVQVLAKLKPLVDVDLTLIDLFRYPTIRQLARFLEKPASKGEELQESVARAEVRKDAMQRRAAMAQRRRGPS